MEGRLDLRALLRVGDDVSLADIDPSSTPGFTGDKDEGEQRRAEASDQLADLQERLFAGGRTGDPRRLLLVLQGMDTAGKGGIVRHVVGAVYPQGVEITAFKAPTHDERQQDFLWRIRRRLPGTGMIGVFDRSHYEDVLVHRVRGLSSPDEVERRYQAIIDFERELVAAGTTVIKVMLHISPHEQFERLSERLERPDKYWKYNPGDADDRMLWPAFMQAYEVALRRTSTEAAPWYVVPANRKWYARLAVQRLLVEALNDLDLGWPPADFDVEAEQTRLAATETIGEAPTPAR